MALFVAGGGAGAASATMAWGTPKALTLPSGAAGYRPTGLNGVACRQPGECVAVGSYTDTSGRQQAMVVSEHGGAWGEAARISLPADADHQPNDVATLKAVAC